MSFAEPASTVLQDKGGSNRNAWIAAFSNLSTSFNLVNINLAHVIIQNQYCAADEDCKAQVAAAGTACLVGAIVGQLTFGYVGDCLGRGPAMRITMLLSICGALASAFAVPVGDAGGSVFTFLSVTRLLLGIGVGGVYPLAATMSAESSKNEAGRGRTVALVFSMQGVGQVLVPVVGLMFLNVVGTPEDGNKKVLNGMSWRLLLGIGALPGLLLAPFRAKAPEPSAPVAAVDGDSERPRHMTAMQALQKPKYLWKLVGTAGGWFIFDITFYGNAIFAPSVLHAIFKTNGTDVPVNGDDISHNLCLQLLITALIGLPGYYVSAFLMDKLGRRNIQMQGFFMMAVMYAILSLDDGLSPGVKLLVYGLTYFFSNFGPNATTFILPSETFPFEVRSTLNGLSAACGKAGAVVGSAGFKPIVDSYGESTAMGLCAGCAIAGLILTFIFVEDRRGKGMAGDSMLQVEPEVAAA